MKKILFRGTPIKETKLNKPVFGYYCKQSAFKFSNCEHLIFDLKSNQLVPVIADTVSQYIGLKDCKWNKIFEGDRLTGHDPDGVQIESFQVEYDEKHSGYFIEDDGDFFPIGYAIEIGFVLEIIKEK